MFSLEEGLRLFWLPGLAAVTGRTSHGLAEWLLQRDFLVVSVTSRTDFVLKALKPDEALKAFAHESSRMACASFETFLGIEDSDRLPRSCGWTNISAYYGAFFAAHGILRMCGTICFQLDAQQKTAIEKVAALFGVLPTSGFETGFYVGTFDSGKSELHLRKSSAASKGSHAVLWEIFSAELRNFSHKMMATSALYNKPALYLSDIRDSLCQKGLSGSWLSTVRNAVNYRHEFGAWFPYKTLRVARKDLVAMVNSWKENPETLTIAYPGDTLRQHVATCTALVSICNMMVNDMRSIGGARSFHTYTSLAVTKLAAQAAA